MGFNMGLMTASDKQAALWATVALGCMEELLKREKPRSARWNRIMGTIEACNRVVDLYRLEAFPFEDMQIAGNLVDMINAELAKHYALEDQAA